MKIEQEKGAGDHEQLLAFHDDATGLRGFLAIHSTSLGPAAGGIRLWSYATAAEAREDALRLSRAMTYKTALAELPAGGGKTVLIEHAGLDRAAAFERLGEIIESLGGRYYAGPDVGVTLADLAAARRSSRYIADESSPELGDISEHTAVGIWHGMRACLEAAGIRRARVAVQGVGNVGKSLARILRREGMEVLLADIDSSRAVGVAHELGAQVVPPEEILIAECDVLAPCALGGVLNGETIPRLRTRIVCGSANNVLSTPDDAEALRQRGTLYAPDYLVNAGGVIRGVDFYFLGLRDSQANLARIYHRMKRVLEISRDCGISTARVADEFAEARWKKRKPSADAPEIVPASAI